MIYKILIFGTGSGCQLLKSVLDFSKVEILAFVDNNPIKVGNMLDDKVIIAPIDIKRYEYDFIVIASQFFSEIKKQLLTMGVTLEKIISYQANFANKPKLDKLLKNSLYVSLGMGDFQLEIARAFNSGKYYEVLEILQMSQKLDKNVSQIDKTLCSLKMGKIETTKELLSEIIEKKLGVSLIGGKNDYNRIVFQKEPFLKSFTTVIIPVYKDRKGLTDTLHSLSKQSIGKENYEIIVANDGADPEISDLCRQSGAKVIEIRPNRGSYFARNRALEVSQGQYLAFTDADVVVPYNWLEKGIKSLELYDYVAGEIKIDENKVRTLTNLYELETAFPVREYVPPFFGPTANLFIKREVVERIGGFDQRLFSGGDREFGDRVYRFSPYNQCYSEEITVLHPPRGYKDLVNKFNRVASGIATLKKLFPNRFFSSPISLSQFTKEILTPPFDIAKRMYLWKSAGSFLKILIYCWWMKFIRLYVYEIKHAVRKI